MKNIPAAMNIPPCAYLRKPAEPSCCNGRHTHHLHAKCRRNQTVFFDMQKRTEKKLIKNEMEWKILSFNIISVTSSRHSIASVNKAIFSALPKLLERRKVFFSASAWLCFIFYGSELHTTLNIPTIPTSVGVY